jgi:hypothetical protein
MKKEEVELIFKYLGKKVLWKKIENIPSFSFKTIILEGTKKNDKVAFFH